MLLKVFEPDKKGILQLIYTEKGVKSVSITEDNELAYDDCYNGWHIFGEIRNGLQFMVLEEKK